MHKPLWLRRLAQGIDDNLDVAIVLCFLVVVGVLLGVAYCDAVARGQA